MKDKIKDSIYNRMFEFLMKHRAADVIRAVNASSTAIQREQKAKHILDWYINNAGEMEPLTDDQLAAVKETWKDIWDTGVVKPEWVQIYTNKSPIKGRGLFQNTQKIFSNLLFHSQGISFITLKSYQNYFLSF